jgi:hypothetical protein
MLCKEDCGPYSSQIAVALLSATLKSEGRADGIGKARSSV